MNRLDDLRKRVEAAQKQDALTDEASAALADLAECLERCRVLEAQGRRRRMAYWASPGRRQLMQRLFGTSTVH